MKEGGLDGGGLAACGLNKRSLKGAEGNLVNEPFFAAWSAWFPGDEGAICNHAADGHAGIVKHGGSMLDGDAAGCGEGCAVLGFHGVYFSRHLSKRNRKNVCV